MANSVDNNNCFVKYVIEIKSLSKLLFWFSLYLLFMKLFIFTVLVLKLKKIIILI